MRTKVLIIIAALLAALSLTSCAGITETGNPKQPSEFSPSISDGANAYINETFGVTIMYPVNWDYIEQDDDSAVTFQSTSNNIDEARVDFEELPEPPSSLLEYLNDEYPGKTFIPYSTETMTGYLYDDPALGDLGGDVREYFFLDVDLLVHVEAQVTEWGAAELGVLLNGISFDN